MHTWDPAWQEAGPLDTSSGWSAPTIGCHALKPCQNRCRSSATLERGLWCGSLPQGSSSGRHTYRPSHHTARTFQVGKAERGQRVRPERSGPDRGSFEDWEGGKWGKCLRKGKGDVGGALWRAITTMQWKSLLFWQTKYKTLHIHFKDYNDLKAAHCCHCHIMQMEEGEYLTLFKEIKDGIFFQYVTDDIMCRNYAVLPCICKAVLHIALSKGF